MNDEISSLLNLPGATIKTWCSFCNKREHSGTVQLELAPGNMVTLPICEVCIEQAKQEGYEIDLTDSPG